MINKSKELQLFFDRQLNRWSQVAQRYADLQAIRVRDVQIGDFKIRLQFNPARAVSTCAKTDAASIAARPCFLCADNRPADQIVCEMFPGYDLLVNPFPIFPMHFTIASKVHQHQDYIQIADMASMAESVPGFVLFYNGSGAGASAPDHLHFQAGNKDFLDICSLMEKNPGKLMKATPEMHVYIPTDLPCDALHYTSKSYCSEMNVWMDTLLPKDLTTGIPVKGMRNILMWLGEDGLLHTLFYPRAKHRPDCYYTTPGYLISPGAVDMAGVLIVTNAKDFETIGAADVRKIFSEVSYSIMEDKQLSNLMLL